MRTVSGEEKREEFITALRELLAKQQKKLMVPAKKKKTKKETAKRDTDV